MSRCWKSVLNVEALENRLVPSSATLTAYRPITPYLNYASYPVPAAEQLSTTLGPGIRYSATVNVNNLIRVDIAAVGTTQLTFTSNLRVFTDPAHPTTPGTQKQILSGSAVTAPTVWVEYVGATATSSINPATMTLNANDTNGPSSSEVVFHSFQSDVIAIGGFSENPANVGNPNLGTFNMAKDLYLDGYDVHMYAETQVNSSGTGTAYSEIVSAVMTRHVTSLAIYGYSWGGGAAHDLAAALKANTAIKGKYVLSYTAYIDAVIHDSIGAETQLPPGTLYDDNVYEVHDFLIHGGSVAGANVNLNVTTTAWGASLTHTTIDDNPMVQDLILTDLMAHVVE